MYNDLDEISRSNPHPRNEDMARDHVLLYAGNLINMSGRSGMYICMDKFINHGMLGVNVHECMGL